MIKKPLFWYICNIVLSVTLAEQWFDLRPETLVCLIAIIYTNRAPAQPLYADQK
jgi:hypothetical protein